MCLRAWPGHYKLWSAVATGPWSKPHHSFLSPHPGKDKVPSPGEQERLIRSCPYS